MTTARPREVMAGHAAAATAEDRARDCAKGEGGAFVDDAQLACVSATGGWFSSASTLILGRD
jgi:hypothetical protein